jgi:8-oxo-dGTP diphosphatase / 2-hydroxy-dATP diphosphatase
MSKLLTLAIVHKDGKVLLGMKKRGFGAGRWNGFGGKVEAGETFEGAARRELREETGIDAASLEKAGVLIFDFKENPGPLEVHVFKGYGFSGEPKESEEMRPQWFDVDKIPFDEMWPDDIHWMPLFLAGKSFRGRFLFGPHDSILEKELEVIV